MKFWVLFSIFIFSFSAEAVLPKTCVEILNKVEALQNPEGVQQTINDEREHKIVRDAFRFYVSDNREFDPDLEWTRSMKRLIDEKSIFKLDEHIFLKPVEVLSSRQFMAVSLRANEVRVDRETGKISEVRVGSENKTPDVGLYHYSRDDGRGGGLYGPLDVQRGKLMTFAALAISQPPDVTAAETSAAGSDIYLTLSDRGLLNYIIPRLIFAVRPARNQKEYYDRFTNALRTILTEPLLARDETSNIDLPVGERVLCHGGVCRHGALIAYVYLNVVRGNKATLVLSLPRGTKNGHAFIVTEDGYILDPLAGVSFKPVVKRWSSSSSGKTQQTYSDSGSRCS